MAYTCRALSGYTVFLIATLLTSGCGGGGGGGGGGGNGGGGPVNPVVTTVTVSPPSPTITVDDTLQMSATARDSAGRPVTGRTVTWTTEDDSKVAIDANGLATGVANGTTRVSARIDNIWGSTAVTVIASTPPPAEVASVELSPDATVSEGDSHQFSATARDANGGVIVGRGSHWSLQNPGIATIDGSGRVTALRPGTTAVTVRIDGQSDSGNLQIVADYPFGLLFDSNQGGAPSLFTLDINDPAAVELPLLTGSAALVEDASASPDGLRIAYSEARPWGSVIFVADRDGSNAIQLTFEGASSDQPDWSPDGTRLAFRRRPTGSGSDIWIIDTDGSNAVNLTADHGATNQASPSWSSDAGPGTLRIAYSHAEGGRSHIWTMRDDGSDKRQITFAPAAFDDQPDWSPDNNRIVYIRSGSAIFGDLYVVNTFGGTGGLLMPLSGPLAGPQRAPAWSPDGQLVAFASQHTGDHFQIYTVWSDGTRLVARTADPADHGAPAWLPIP